jgi:hypothetical protein
MTLSAIRAEAPDPELFDALVAQSQSLVSEHGENPEYDRALSELTAYASGLPGGDYAPLILSALRTPMTIDRARRHGLDWNPDRPSWEPGLTIPTRHYVGAPEHAVTPGTFDYSGFGSGTLYGPDQVRLYGTRSAAVSFCEAEGIDLVVIDQLAHY